MQNSKDNGVQNAEENTWTSQKGKPGGRKIPNLKLLNLYSTLYVIRFVV
jgi:hypothetical protein